MWNELLIGVNGMEKNKIKTKLMIFTLGSVELLLLPLLLHKKKEEFKCFSEQEAASHAVTVTRSAQISKGFEIFAAVQPLKSDAARWWEAHDAQLEMGSVQLQQHAAEPMKSPFPLKMRKFFS
jgi:hypothetical protein